MAGAGCPKCKSIKIGNLKRSNKKKFITKANKIHNNKYNYSKVKYLNNYSKVTIICPKHNEFKQSPNCHLSKQGCPKCSHKISRSSQKWLNKIEKQLGYKIKREYSIGIGKITSDGFNPITNTCYEYNGNYWHGNPKVYNLSDINPSTKTTFGELYQKTLEREKLVKSAGYNLVIKWGN